MIKIFTVFDTFSLNLENLVNCEKVQLSFTVPAQVTTSYVASDLWKFNREIFRK